LTGYPIAYQLGPAWEGVSASICSTWHHWLPLTRKFCACMCAAQTVCGCVWCWCLQDLGSHLGWCADDLCLCAHLPALPCPQRHRSDRHNLHGPAGVCAGLQERLRSCQRGAPVSGSLLDGGGLLGLCCSHSFKHSNIHSCYTCSEVIKRRSANLSQTPPW